MQKNIVLAFGDRNFEDFFKKSINKLITGLNSPNFDNMVVQVQSIINQPTSKDERTQQKHEVLLDFFEGDTFLSQISLKKLQMYKASGIENITFSDEAAYREVVVQKVSQSRADVLIITERLQGQSDFIQLLHELKISCPGTQVIVIGCSHSPGDSFFSDIIARGVYDITYGQDINIGDIIRMIFCPQSYKDVANLLGDGHIQSTAVNNQLNSGYNSSASITPPQPQNEKKTFRNKKKESLGNSVVSEPSTKTDTDMLNLTPLGSVVNSGTQMLSIANPNEGMVFLPYEMKPVVITEYENQNGVTSPHYTTLFPDGHVEDGSNLPAVITPTSLETSYQSYITSLIDASQGEQPTTDAASFVPPTIKRAKTIVFTSARQGVGCSTIALNVATAIATQEHKVLFLDTNFDHGATYTRLELPRGYKGLEDTFGKGNEMLQYPLSKQTLVSTATGSSIARFKNFPDNLFFLQWTDSFQIGDARSKGEDIKQSLNTLSTDFEYIIIDCNLMFNLPLYDEIYKFANLIFPVITQDIYEANLTVEALSNYEGVFDIANKIGVIVNKYCNLKPHASQFASDFYNTDRIFSVNEDTKGFITSYSGGDIYYSESFGFFSGKGKAKIGISQIADYCI